MTVTDDVLREAAVLHRERTGEITRARQYISYTAGNNDLVVRSLYL
jgi:hypothetical protein